jgi:FkbM family methyltransferase
MRVLPAHYSRKPQYVFHPRRALGRALYRFRAREGHRAIAELPWGLPLEVHMSDAIGFSVRTGGVFDPCVTETLHRLIDPGDVVVDAGANIGYLTSLAAVRAGPTGSVLALEPHPRVFEALESNADRWRGRDELAELDLRRLALSDESGPGELVAGPRFEANMGLAALRSDDSDDAHPDAGEVFTVTLARLDDVVGDRQIGLLKIDVEGHEAGVLRGGRRMLADRAVRDIVFEDHDPYPSEATALVEAAGFTLISLDNDLLGLRLERPQDRNGIEKWPGPSYLATLEPDRALQRLRPRGWRVNGIGPSLRGRRLSRRR